MLQSLTALTLVIGLLAGLTPAQTPVQTEAPPAQSAAPAAEAALPNTVWQLRIEGVIGPAISDLLERTIRDAGEQGVHLLILTMDTPGGLDTSMRAMIHQIIDAQMPVATFVYPKGARAASAGTYLLLASHIAAMAPATNLGAATPVQIGMPGTPQPPQAPSDDKQGDKEQPPASSAQALQKKIMNDAIAYIRGLAALHDRNADWAEQAVREAASLEADKALEMNVIDLVANDINDLLDKIDGRVVQVRDRDYRLQTGNTQLVEIIPDWRHRFLSTITNPNVAYILMLLGIYGLLMEFYNPGMGLPGIVGGICLITALYALQLLPISYAGLALIALGIGLMITEALSPSFGVFGFGGVVAFAVGSVMLIDTELPGFQIALPIIAAFTLFTAGVCLLVLALALKARKGVLVSGVQTLVGQPAVALDNFHGQGKVQLNGEIWNARCTGQVQRGETVTVVAVNGLVLEVSKQGQLSPEEPP
ncbi:nodulation protein NfeD [Marinobacterium sp. CAU 1594]|nr:nodulation protein NfeD [Marinobacterium arenosum]